MELKKELGTNIEKFLVLIEVKRKDKESQHNEGYVLF